MLFVKEELWEHCMSSYRIAVKCAYENLALGNAELACQDSVESREMLIVGLGNLCHLHSHSHHRHHLHRHPLPFVNSVGATVLVY